MKTLVTALLAASILAGGCGSSANTAITPSPTPTATSETIATATPTRPVTSPSRVERQRKAAAKRRAKAVAKRRARTARKRHQRYLASLTKTFSGDGGLNLPPLTLPRDSTMRWTSAGGFVFQVWDTSSDGDIFVNSQARSGKTFMGAGRYRLKVNTVGAWTMRITPGS